MLFCLMTLNVQTVFAQGEDSSSTDGEEMVASGAVANDSGAAANDTVSEVSTEPEATTES